MAKAEDNSNKDEHWPWDWQKEKEPTPAVLVKIVKNLAFYANNAAYRSPEEVGMSNSLSEGFDWYCNNVKNHFEKTAKEAPNTTKTKLSGLAEEAFDLIDKLHEYVDKPSSSYMTLYNQWDTLVRKFDLCMSSQGVKNGQDEPPPQGTPSASGFS